MWHPEDTFQEDVEQFDEETLETGDRQTDRHNNNIYLKSNIQCT